MTKLLTRRNRSGSTQQLCSTFQSKNMQNVTKRFVYMFSNNLNKLKSWKLARNNNRLKYQPERTPTKKLRKKKSTLNSCQCKKQKNSTKLSDSARFNAKNHGNKSRMGNKLAKSNSKKLLNQKMNSSNRKNQLCIFTEN
ncbi:Hypothetical_protein [Hexamita inflata]|uniref:Hypothetical_protein n=1 Tax=Hexamita inflata TaxID=28002 RepID=A0AA86TYE4_9EUKA|nr:Hypothetical protein HINF_LOCUS12933 [Hexamita inflata]